MRISIFPHITLNLSIFIFCYRKKKFVVKIIAVFYFRYENDILLQMS